MVHALETVHRLLTPAGIIISVHDLAEPSPVDVAGDGRVVRVGEMDDDSDYALLRYTDAALDQVVEDGLFVVGAREVFDYISLMDSLETFDDWLAGAWDTIVITEADYARLKTAVRAVKGAPEIIIHRSARMTRLVKL